jgi:DivIVA domain-containing protein
VSLVLLLVVLAVIGGIAVVASGRWSGLPDVEPDRSPRGELSADGDVGREQVDGLRFTLALRGYRMDEVDDVLDRLVEEIDRRGARIRELEAQLAEPREPSTQPTQEG